MTSNILPTYDKTQQSLWYDFLFNLSYKQNNKSISNLIDFFIDNTKDNINVSFIRVGGDKTYLNTTFEEVYSILASSSHTANEEERQLWDKLISKGMDFNKNSIQMNEGHYISEEQDFLKLKDQNDVTIEEKHALFQTMNKKNIYLLDKHTEVYGIEETRKKLLKYSTMHACVNHNEVEFLSYILNKYNLDINTPNESGQTLLMLVRTPEMLNLILEKKPNALLKDINKVDAINMFTFKIKNGRNEYMNMAIDLEKYILNNAEINQESKEEQIKRKETTLINFVETDKTKKDIEDYIRKVKLQNLGKIVNSAGINMAYLCIQKQSWAKFPLFYDKENSQFKSPKTGRSYLQLMLSQDITSRKDAAKNVLKTLISDYRGDISDMMYVFTQEQITNKKPFQIANWITEDKSLQRFLSSKTGLEISFEYCSHINHVYSFDELQKNSVALSKNFETYLNIILKLKPEQKLTFHFPKLIEWKVNKTDEIDVKFISFFNYKIVKEFTLTHPDFFSEEHINNIKKIDEEIVTSVIKQLNINDRERKFRNNHPQFKEKDLYTLIEVLIDNKKLIEKIKPNHIEEIRKDDEHLARRLQYHCLQNNISEDKSNSNKFKI